MKKRPPVFTKGRSNRRIEKVNCHIAEKPACFLLLCRSVLMVKQSFELVHESIDVLELAIN